MSHAHITYNLSSDQPDSNLFYQDLQRITDHIINQMPRSIKSIISDFRQFVNRNHLETLRSFNEYAVELLSIGIFWNVYSQNAAHLSHVKRSVLNFLFQCRQKNQRLKPLIDKLRGKLISAWLTRADEQKSIYYNFDNFMKLLWWLEASGDFREEVKRFAHWQKYFAESPPLAVTDILFSAVQWADYFEIYTEKALGRYTKRVDEFLQHQHKKYANREDIIFTGRRKVEYHLNMVAAEILNREFKSDFEETYHKIVLLPTCMRTKTDNECKAHRRGFDIQCAGCDASCHINRITRMCRELAVETRLVPHSSQFTQWLKQYQGNKNMGLVGVACVLNLLTGGYEMKNLGLDSQCVFLDYCGCKKHWHETGIPTHLNIERLKHVLRCVDQESKPRSIASEAV